MSEREAHMGPESVKGSPELANNIRTRRLELGLTIEEAAKKAGVGIKTWCRYETGESIRKDKCIGVCRALNWRELPNSKSGDCIKSNIERYMKSDAWSDSLAECYGKEAAISFVIGSDILLDDIEQDLEQLASMPKGTHIGQLECSFIADMMPMQFLTRYDYEFLYTLRAEVILMRRRIKSTDVFFAYSVLEELILYLILEESRVLMEEMDVDEYWKEWIFDVFGDADIEMALYSDYCISADSVYHFEHWQEKHFYCKEK